jgi:hypothetical protein
MNFFHRILTHLPVSQVFPVLSKLTHTQHKKSSIYQFSIIISNKRRIIQGHHNAKIPARKPGRGFYHLFGHCRQNRSAYFYSFQVPSSKLFTLVYTIHVNYLAAAAFASLIFSVSIGTILFKSPTIP